jgi:hypothetical protein
LGRARHGKAKEQTMKMKPVLAYLTAISMLTATMPIAPAMAGGSNGSHGGGNMSGGCKPGQPNQPPSVYKPTNINTNINVFKPININKNINVNNNIDNSKNINVYKPVSITNNIDNSKNININKNINVNNNIDNSKNINIVKNIDNSKNININKNVNINKSIVINKGGGGGSSEAIAAAIAVAVAAASANASVNNTVNVNASSSSSSSSSLIGSNVAAAVAAAGAVSYGGGGYIQDQQMYAGGNVDVTAEIGQAQVQEQCVYQDATVVKAIHAVCVSAEGREFPASHMTGATWLDAAYEGEVVRCIPGSRLKVMIGAVVQSDQGMASSFTSGKEVDCALGEAMRHFKDGMLKCAIAVPVKDCTERTNLRLFGTGDLFFTYRTRVCAQTHREYAENQEQQSATTQESYSEYSSSASSSTESQLKGMQLDGGANY